MVVPLLPHSSWVVGFRSRGVPWITTSSPVLVIRAPSCSMQERVEVQSALVEKLVRRDTPSANDAIIAVRWEIDLSPGKRSDPRILRLGEISIL